MALNKAQLKFRNEFLKNHKKERLASQDTSEFCFSCKMPGDCRDLASMFAAFIPPINPNNHSKGLMMDAIEAIWICGPCSNILRTSMINNEESE